MKKKLAAICLGLALLLSISPSVMALEHRASAYIYSYSARALSEGNGMLRIYFTITSTGADMDMIGASTISVYESDGTFVDTISYVFDEPGMMAYDTWYMDSSVPFQGVRGTEYYAKVTFYAEKDGGYDFRYYTTDSVVAK